MSEALLQPLFFFPSLSLSTALYPVDAPADLHAAPAVVLLLPHAQGECAESPCRGFEDRHRHQRLPYLRLVHRYTPQLSPVSGSGYDSARNLGKKNRGPRLGTRVSWTNMKGALADNRNHVTPPHTPRQEFTVPEGAGCFGRVDRATDCSPRSPWRPRTHLHEKPYFKTRRCRPDRSASLVATDASSWNRCVRRLISATTGNQHRRALRIRQGSEAQALGVVSRGQKLRWDGFRAVLRGSARSSRRGRRSGWCPGRRTWIGVGQRRRALPSTPGSLASRHQDHRGPGASRRTRPVQASSSHRHRTVTWITWVAASTFVQEARCAARPRAVPDGLGARDVLARLMRYQRTWALEQRGQPADSCRLPAGLNTFPHAAPGAAGPLLRDRGGGGGGGGGVRLHSRLRGERVEGCITRR